MSDRAYMHMEETNDDVTTIRIDIPNNLLVEMTPWQLVCFRLGLLLAGMALGKR